MNLNQDIILTTNRLILSPVREEFIDDINTNFTKEITEFMPFNPVGDKNEIINFVKNSKMNLLEKKEIVFVILNKQQEFIGCCGIHNINKESVEVGLWIKKNAQNQGFGLEIVTCLIDYIEKNLKISYIIYPVDKENIRSRKIPEKLGFVAYQTFKEYKNEQKDLDIIEYRKYYGN